MFKKRLAIHHAVPIAMLDAFSEYSQMHLALAHLVAKSSEYRDYFRKSPKFKIMDNGACELGKSLNQADLIDLAQSIRANVVCAPDVLYDAVATAELSKEFLLRYERVLRKNRLKVMLIPQGNTLESLSFCCCFFELLAYQYKDLVTHIGVSYISTPKVAGDYLGVSTDRVECTRPYIVDLFHSQFRTLRPDLKYHLLGLGNPIELRLYHQVPYVVSADSSIAFQFAMSNTAVKSELGTPRNVYKRADKEVKSFEFDLPSASVAVRELASYNMKVINSFASRRG